MVWGHNRWLLQSRSSLSFCFVLATLGGMQDQFPDQESNPGPLRWEYGVLTTGPPGTSSSVLNKKKKIDQKMGLVLNPSPSCVCWVHLLIHPTLHQTKEGSHIYEWMFLAGVQEWPLQFPQTTITAIYSWPPCFYSSPISKYWLGYLHCLWNARLPFQVGTCSDVLASVVGSNTAAAFPFPSRLIFSTSFWFSSPVSYHSMFIS